MDKNFKIQHIFVQVMFCFIKNVLDYILYTSPKAQRRHIGAVDPPIATLL